MARPEERAHFNKETRKLLTKGTVPHDTVAGRTKEIVDGNPDVPGIGVAYKAYAYNPKVR